MMTVQPKTIGMFSSLLSKKLFNELTRLGHRILKFPPIQKKAEDSSAIELDKLSNLENFEWIIFTDVFAVDFFLQKIEDLDIDFFELDDLRVCAYGEAVADRLRFVQLHADVIAAKQDEKEVIKQIKDYIFDENGFSGLNFLVVGRQDHQSPLKKNLAKNNAGVSEVGVYRAEVEKNISKIKTFAKGGTFDEIVCFSPDEVFDLSILFENENLCELFEETVFFAADEITFQTLREFSLNPKFLK